MTFPLLVVLWLAIAALGAALPVAIGSVRQGRQAGWALSVVAAARGGLAEAERGAWVGGGGAVPLGTALSLPPLAPRPGVTVVREARRVGADLWVITADARLLSAGGEQLARSEQGLIVRVAAPPGDTVVGVFPIARPWFRRPP